MFAEFRCFLAVIEAGTLTAAARRIGISQPALSATIHRLEDELGARLLDRGRRGAQPTAAGAALIGPARAALAAVEDGRRAVLEVEGLERGEVRVGAGATACTYLLPPFLAAFRREHPGIRFLLRESTTEEARQGLAAGELDLAVVSSDAGEAWLRDELILVGAPDLEPASASFVTFRRGATTRALLERFIPDAEIVMELGSIAAVKGNVRAGIGLALVSRVAVQRDLSQGLLVEVAHPATPIRRTLRILHRGRGRLPPAARALLEVLVPDARPPH